jgi:hypothetical protein
MTDTTIIRIAEETSRALEDAHPFSQCLLLVPSYNALLQAAKANHPDDPFLRVLTTLSANGEVNSISVAELRALLGQLRIALESMQEEHAAGG